MSKLVLLSFLGLLMAFASQASPLGETLNLRDMDWEALDESQDSDLDSLYDHLDRTSIDAGPPGSDDDLTIPGLNETDRIIGGSQAPNGQYPFAAAILNNNRHWCGGTLVTTWYVLTAAHCVFPNVAARSITVRVGSNHRLSGGQLRGASQLFKHQTYRQLPNDEQGAYDVGLIHLSSQVSLNRFIRPALMVGPGYVPRVGTVLIAVGWGRTNQFNVLDQGPDLLKHAALAVRACRGVPSNTPNINSIICAYGTDNFSRTCNGDSGGFLGGWSNSDNNWIVVGVTSFSIPTRCTDPVGYSSVSYYNRDISNRFFQ